MKVKLVIPYPLDAQGVASRLARIPAGAVGSGLRVDPVAVERARSNDSEHEGTLQAVAVTAAAVSAQDDGYDAVVLDGIADPGLYALRSRLSIPVVGAGLASYTLAVTLGRRFSILAPAQPTRREIENTLRLHGLESKCASIREIGGATASASPEDGGDDLRIALLAGARKALDEDGADVIVVGATSLHASARQLADALPAPVIDPGLVALQIVERTLLLGLSHSKAAFPAPRTIQDEKLSPLLANR